VSFASKARAWSTDRVLQKNSPAQESLTGQDPRGFPAAWRAESALCALEALVAFAIIMAYVWKWRFTHPMFWFPVVGLIFASQVAHGRGAAALGLRIENFGICLRRFGPALIVLALTMFAAGLVLRTIRPIGVGPAMLSFVLSLPWGLFQQYLLIGYFLTRFEAVLSRSGAAILTSALFSVVHSPNWFLMLATPVAAYAAIWVYRQQKNLYFLGLAHGTSGTLLFLVVTDSVSHHLRVGPGWFGHS
jgi:hypothetical protein